MSTMILSRKVASALATVALSSYSYTGTVSAFSFQAIVSSSARNRIHNVCRVENACVLQAAAVVDTDSVLPSFSTKEEYTSYMKAAGKLPTGFAVGTASGDFISVEAPAMGKLPIKATVIHLTEGPTDSWAAVFTSNKVCGSVWLRHLLVHSVCSMFFSNTI